MAPRARFAVNLQIAPPFCRTARKFAMDFRAQKMKKIPKVD